MKPTTILEMAFAMLAAVALGLAAPATAQQTCRAADITSDGVVAAPDFLALGNCFGRDVSEGVPSGD